MRHFDASALAKRYIREKGSLKLRRLALTKRDQRDISDRPEDSIHGGGDGLPPRLLGRELLLSGRG